MDLKQALTGKNDKAIIVEVERGEDHIKAKFEIALKDTDLEPATRSVIREAFTSVKAGHGQASALKHSIALQAQFSALWAIACRPGDFFNAQWHWPHMQK